MTTACHAHPAFPDAADRGTVRFMTEIVELLQQLIRNRCVNEGDGVSGDESRSADTLETLLDLPGVQIERYAPTSGRASLVARLEGRDKGARSLALLSHTDVVPVSPQGWNEDPFGGELIDGEVWGRGAVDMLNQTASMALAFRDLARSGWRPKGDLIFIAAADEEAGGVHGARWMIENERDAVWADHVLTEVGGPVRHTPDGPVIEAHVGEKGGAGARITVRGTPGHGSMPFAADNALLSAGAVIARLAEMPPYQDLGGFWPDWVASQPFTAETKAALLDPNRVEEALASLPPDVAKRAHACCHATISPNVIHGGGKRNVIPDEVIIEVDQRILPGDSVDAVMRRLTDWLAVFGDRVSVEIIPPVGKGATLSPTGTELWKIMGDVERGVASWCPADAEPVRSGNRRPFLSAGRSRRLRIQRAVAADHPRALLVDVPWLQRADRHRISRSLDHRFPPCRPTFHDVTAPTMGRGRVAVTRLSLAGSLPPRAHRRPEPL